MKMFLWHLKVVITARAIAKDVRRKIVGPRAKEGNWRQTLTSEVAVPREYFIFVFPDQYT